MDLVDLSRQTFIHLVGEVHNGIVFERSLFIELGKEVAIFAVGIEQSLTGCFVEVLVEHGTAIETEDIAKHGIALDFVTRKVEPAHVVATTFGHVDVDDNIARGLDVIVLVKGRNHVLNHVTHKKLAFVSGTLFDLEEGINFRVIPLAARNQVKPFLTGAFIADNVVQESPCAFFVLDLRLTSCKRILVRGLAHVPIIVRHFHRRLARNLVKRVRRISHSLVQLRIERGQTFSNRHHASKIEQAGRIREVFGMVVVQFCIQVTEMAENIQHGIAVGFKDIFLEFATAPPLVFLREHVICNFFDRHMVIALHVKAADTHLVAFANHESHLVLVFVHRFFAVAHFGKEEAFGAVMVEHSLASAFQLSLAIDLTRNHVNFQAEVIFGNFVTTIQNSGIESREFLDLKDQVHIGTIVANIIHPGSHIVKQARSIKRAHGILNFFGKRSRGIALPVANTDTAKHRTVVHMDRSFDLDLMDLIFDHIALGHFGHVQKLGLGEPHKY